MRKKHALVLEGGAMRGLFSAGVMDVLMENDIHFDGIAGVSAGAAFGCNYKSRQPGRVLRYNLRFCRDRRYCSWYSRLTTGDLFGADFCYRRLPDELDVFDTAEYDRDPMEYFVVCTDVLTGKPFYRACPAADHTCYQWMRASASMPLVSQIVFPEPGGRGYLDGAISDSIPLRFMEQRGYEKSVVVLTQKPDYCKTPQRGMFLLRKLLKKYPALITALENRHTMYNETLSYIRKRAAEGAVLVIQPQEDLPLGRICHDPEKLRAAWETGRKTALHQLDELRAFLEK